jgi:hypothetical protein
MWTGTPTTEPQPYHKVDMDHVNYGRDKVGAQEHISVVLTHENIIQDHYLRLID